VKFYERMLGFHAFGAIREDPRVQAPPRSPHTVPAVQQGSVR
jgi:hypothetical protein